MKSSVAIAMLLALSTNGVQAAGKGSVGPAAVEVPVAMIVDPLALPVTGQFSWFNTGDIHDIFVNGVPSNASLWQIAAPTGGSIAFSILDTSTPFDTFALTVNGVLTGWTQTISDPSFQTQIANLNLSPGMTSVSVKVTTSTDGSAQFAFGPVAPTTPVPEPSTYAMMLAGLAALGLMAKRRLS